jgi:SprT protein
MAKAQMPLHALQQYLPKGSLDDVLYYLQHHRVHLTITRDRSSVLGDYRHSHLGKNHRISVNGGLNPYAFLITLLHELAHLFTYERYGHRVQPHGTEWKNEFSKVLAQFMAKKVFPPDVEKALLNTLHNPAASSCADEQLLRVLYRYDARKEGMVLVEQLPEGALFAIKGGRVFRRGQRMRKRFKCTELASGRDYLFSPVYEVEWVQQVPAQP